MSLKKVTDDYSAVTNDMDPEDITSRIVARAYRDQKRKGPPESRMPPTRSRERDCKRQKKLRQARLKNKLCTACGGERETMNYRLCARCRARWRIYNARCQLRKLFPLTMYGGRLI